MLLTQSDAKANAKELTDLRGELSRLNISARDSSEFQQLTQEFLEQLGYAAGLPNLPNEDQNIIADERRELALAVALREQESLSLSNQCERIELLLNEKEGCFARDQLLRFVRSHRYTLTPFRTANAIAGLPFIGWRQSAKRCSKWKHPDGFSYQTFKTVDRIIKSCSERTEMINHAERWLRNRPQGTKFNAVRDLQWGWYYLKRSMQTALAARAHPKALPFLITRLYFEKSESPSAVDSILEYRERIIPRSRKIKVS
jgi:hypothetical protein